MSTQKSKIFPNFGLALKEALDSIGQTPAWLSRVTGKDKGQISKYISNKTTPKRVTQLELIAPLPYNIEEQSNGWVLVRKGSEVNRVHEEVRRYNEYSIEKRVAILNEIFTEIERLQLKFNELTNQPGLSESEKGFQLEMISKKITQLTKSIGGKEG